MREWMDSPGVQSAQAQLEKMAGRATIRLTVDLPCQETFFVTDKVTGLIVQGDCIPRDSTHCIVLEGTLGLGVQDRGFPEFTVVDIDNWLEGNKFI